MSLIESFKEFALLGAEWVMWVLIALSVVSVSLMFERWRFFRRCDYDPALLARRITPFVRVRDFEGARGALAQTPGMEASVLAEGFAVFDRGPAAVEEALAAATARERIALDQHVWFLGTLGNNAPFVGLFGTVLGIIVAFQKLSESDKDSSKLVMQGISEALVATAVGILVAIPAVVAFNLLQRRVKRVVARTDSLCHVLLAEAKAIAPGERR